MNTIEFYKEHFDQLQSASNGNGLSALRQEAFRTFSNLGIPSARHEEWKYTRIGGLFNKEYQLPVNLVANELRPADVDPFRLPGYEAANELVFINGLFSFALSIVRSADLIVLPLETAAHEYKDVVASNLGHSGRYLNDGINALNTALVHGAVFIHVKRGKTVEHPVYIYNITNTATGAIFSQPRSLIYISENASVQIVETYNTLGIAESFTNQVMELAMEKDSHVEYYKIENDAPHANLVSSTHFRQVGKSYLHTVTISLGGAIVRNNLNVILEAEYCEAHLYGLYFHNQKSHIDNHTIVDNVKPNCFSNELYKGVLDGQSSGVFNGKIYVRPQAQKTNAYQSNKNILLSDSASVNTKPQLEIFADDVKCSHGCTIGQLDEEALFYLKSRGIGENIARSLLVGAFATDILEHIHPVPVKNYVEQLISKRLEFDVS